MFACLLGKSVRAWDELIFTHTTIHIWSRLGLSKTKLDDWCMVILYGQITSSHVLTLYSSFVCKVWGSEIAEFYELILVKVYERTRRLNEFLHNMRCFMGFHLRTWWLLFVQRPHFAHALSFWPRSPLLV